MMLFIDGISREIERTNVTYWVEEYESAFELLNQLVADDWTLQHITIVEGDESITLPVEAFDGQPILEDIRALQQQWSQVLSAKYAPTLNQFGRQRLKDRLAKLDAYYNSLLSYLGKMISLLETKRQQLKNNPLDGVRFRLDSQYDLLLKSNRRMYQRTKKDRKKNQQRLHKLEIS